MAAIRVDLSSPERWQPSPGWLSNPASTHEVARGVGLRFSVAPPGRGMKWRHELVQPVSTQGRSVLTVRYRARRITRNSDYFLHASDFSGGNKPREFVAIPLSAIVDDEAWHQLSVEVPVMEIHALAVQVQAGAADTFVEIASLTFAADRPTLLLKDYLDVQADWPRTKGHRPVTLPAHEPAKPWLDGIGVDASGLSQERLTVEGIPFHIHAPEPKVLATPLEQQDEVAVELNSRAEAIYLFMGARFTGQESPSIGSGPLVQVRHVERFAVRVEYADGVSDLIFPARFPSGCHVVTQEPAVYVVRPTRPSRIKRLRLLDQMRQGQFVLMGLTLGPRPAARTEPTASTPPMPLRFLSKLPSGSVATKTAALEVAGGEPQIKSLINRATQTAWLASPSPLFNLETSDKIEAQVRTKPLPGGEIELTLEIRNNSRQAVTVTPTFPLLEGFSPGGDPGDLAYCFPRRGCAISACEASLRDPYSGRFPLQFMDVYHPQAGGWYLMVQDTSNAPKTFWLNKRGKIDLGVDYWPTTLQPNESWRLPRAILGAHRGDWHDALRAYRQWLAGWYQPLLPRKQWFREVFNFRQHFLHVPMPRASGLFDLVTRRLDFMPTLESDAQQFGGIDFLHLFDWGWSPDGVGLGDYNCWEYFGGLDNFTKQLRAVEKADIPVGLYVEGYLVNPRSDVGKSNGAAWQMLQENGEPYAHFAPNLNMCPHVPGWQEHLTEVFRRVARQTDAKGYYIDEFGNASLYVCHNPSHGHPVPMSPLQGEMALTRKVRQAIPVDAVLYTEDTPTDVTSQYQDGSFTYAITCTIEALTAVPLNLTRFALPDFKTFEIIACDAPLRDDQQAVKRVFFNGEGIWLEGVADDWFAPETRRLIAKTHEVLRKHRQAFTSLDAEPLVPTLKPDVWANRFSETDETVWTLYNSSHQTVRSRLLAVKYLPGSSYYDAWNQRPLRPQITGNQAVLSLELGPRDVGCVVQAMQHKLRTLK